MRHETPGRTMLVIGHPGHELRAYGWVAREKPLVCILTDGSGSDGLPRIDHSLGLLRDLGARLGSLRGELSDRRIYLHVLKGEARPFELIAERLAQVMLDERIELVVSDGIEGYNPTHDLCEVISSVAVARAQQRGSGPIQHLAMALLGDPATPPGFPRPLVEELVLSSPRFTQKRDTTLAYAQLGGPTLQQEIDAMLWMFGEQAFQRELFFSGITPGSGWEKYFEQERPFYEIHGEQQVAAGRYQSVIRFREHVQPVVERLSVLAGQSLEEGRAQDARIDH